MFRFLRAGLGTKVGIALIGAVLVLGGGTAVAMASTHTALPFSAPLFQSGSPTAHSESDEGSKTPNATKEDQDDQGCTASATGTPSAQSDSDDESGTPSASSTATGGDNEANEHESGTPSATGTATHADDEANEHESGQEDQDECGTSKATGTPAPQSTEQPEEMQTPGPTPTKGPGGD